MSRGRKNEPLEFSLESKNAITPEYGENSRMMVPLRFFSEVFGAEVKWDQTTKTVTIIL